MTVSIHRDSVTSAAARFLRPVLYFHAVLLVALAVVLFFAHAVPLTQREPILATRVGDLFLAFAAILVLVARGYQRDRRWLLVPILVLLAEFLNSVVQLVIQVSGSTIPTDPMLIPPLLINLVFLVYYAIAGRGIATADSAPSSTS